MQNDSTEKKPKQPRPYRAHLPGGIYRPRELSVLVGLSQATIWRMRQRGEFPEPVKLSRGATGWPDAIVQKWISERTAGQGDTGASV